MNHLQSVLEECQLKSQAWKRTLEYLLHENIMLKIRLSNLLKTNHTNSLFLEIAEQYQSRFIGKDEIFGFIRRDVAEFDHQLDQERIVDESQVREITLKQKRLQKEIFMLETTFIDLKTEFNKKVEQEFTHV